MARGNFGERLKRERELREVTPNEIVVATRISLRFLDALENEDWEKLPGGVFNRGFVRAIARYLGLDEENLLAEYDLAYGDESANGPVSAEQRIPSPPKWIAVALALAALAVLAAAIAAGVYGWKYYSARRRASASSGVVKSVASSSAGAMAANPSDLDLSVATSATTHVRILADSELLLDSEVPAGQTRHFSAIATFEVTAADPKAVLLELNGQPMPGLGAARSFGTIVLSRKDLRPATLGNTQP
jgi:cytoskeleton protein RodZ